MKLTILFLHHRQCSVTRYHLEQVRKLNPFLDVIPLCFSGNSGLPNATYVRASSRFPSIQWASIDSAVYEWFEKRGNSHADAYVIFEYDTLCAMPVSEFYSDVLDKPIAAAKVEKFPSNWYWFKTSPFLCRDEHLNKYLRGVVPFSGVLIQHDVLQAVCDVLKSENLGMLFSECRIATAACIAGFEPVTIRPDASRFIHWARVTPEGAGIWHPVKSLSPEPGSSTVLNTLHS